MLTIKEPMQMQSISTLRTYSDVLGEKIAANYQLIGTTITGAELLHIATQTPEQFLNMEYNEMLTVENHIHTDNRIKIELINQLVNRLMLCFTPKFTYQDEVFVASVLQKMGIVNVAEFMQQIHRHTDQNTLLAELINHYFSRGAQILEAVDHYHRHCQNHYGAAVQEVYDREYQSDYYLHNDIFRRLRTAESNNIIYSYNCQTDRGKTAMQGVREAVWAEQADAVQLSQFRKLLFFQTNPAFWQRDMYYERKPFEQGKLTEKKVVQRVAAAVLENIVQKLHCVQQQYHDGSGVEWRDYTHVFCHSAKDVIERFWYFQSEKDAGGNQWQNNTQVMMKLIQDERMLSHLLETVEISDGSDIVRALWENQNIQKQLAVRIRLDEQLVEQAEDEAAYMEELRAFREAYQVFAQRERTWEIRKQQENQNNQAIPDRMEQQSVWETLKQRETGNRQEILNRAEEQSVEEVLRQWEEQSGQSRFDRAKAQDVQMDDEDVSGQEQYHRDSYYDYLNEFLSRCEEVVVDLVNQKGLFAENAALLEQINQHNLYMKQLLENEDKASVHGDVTKRIVVDSTRARQSALRAMENPQEMLHEIYENAAPIERVPSQEIEKILRVTDEKSRLFYRKLLGYQIEPEIPAQTEKEHAAADDRFIESAAARYGAANVAKDNIEMRSESEASAVNIDKVSPVTYNYHETNTEPGVTYNYHETNTGNTGGGTYSFQETIAENLNTVAHDYHKSSTIEYNTDAHSIPEASTDISDTSAYRFQETSTDILGAAVYSFQEAGTEVSAAASYDFHEMGTGNRQTDEAQVSYENSALTAVRGVSANADDMRVILKRIEENENRIYEECLFFRKNIDADDEKVFTDGILAEITERKISMNVMENSGFQGIHFVHKAETQISEMEQFDEANLSAERNHILKSQKVQTQIQTELERMKQEQIRQKEATQQQITDIKYKLSRESEEQITRMINDNLKTQVHTISDIVYHDLERRLKNEQRRRGY